MEYKLKTFSLEQCDLFQLCTKNNFLSCVQKIIYKNSITYFLVLCYVKLIKENYVKINFVWIKQVILSKIIHAVCMCKKAVFGKRSLSALLIRLSMNRNFKIRSTYVNITN